MVDPKLKKAYEQCIINAPVSDRIAGRTGVGFCQDGKEEYLRLPNGVILTRTGELNICSTQKNPEACVNETFQGLLGQPLPSKKAAKSR